MIDSKADKRTRRAPQVLIFGLVLLITIPAYLYIWATGSNARDFRIRDTLSRNQSTAELGARLLDEQYNSQFSTARRIARSQEIVRNLLGKDPHRAQATLAGVARSMDDLVFVAVYSRDGSLVVERPQGSSAPLNVSDTDWYRSFIASPRPPHIQITRLREGGRDTMVALAVPLGIDGRSGYLLVSRRDSFFEWLKRLSLEGGALYIVSSAGEIVASTGGASSVRPMFQNFQPHRLAQKRLAGSEQGLDPTGKEDWLTGYAYAAQPGCSVLVVQSTNSAFASTYRLILLSMLAPLLLVALVVGSAVQLSRAYRKLEELAAELEAQNLELQAASKAKSDILANVSHELRTPLASMQISISGMLETDVRWKPEQLRECLRSAMEDIDQMDMRIKNLLQMSRMDRAYRLKTELADLTDIAASALERLRTRTRDRTLCVDFPPYPLMVEADHGLMELVIVNLLENALKYSPPGSALHLSGDARGEMALFTLRDEGSGVPHFHREFIFDKFYRAPNNSAIEGTGLGLAICKSIIDAHKGSIGVRDGSPCGAEFWFTLPLLSPVIRGIGVEEETRRRGEEGIRRRAAV